jgi:hypothetical protein
MDLSPEDQLRINVLLAHELEAVRIDEQNLVLYALSKGNEARIPLHPNCRPEKYLKRVREVLSQHALGTPSGYPVFLQRWTRMGQAHDAQLARLLLLGEPEAIVAVAGAPGLTAELARRVWWAMPTADIARRMLEREAVRHSEMGQVLSEFLIEYLPFETEPLTVVQTVRLILEAGHADDETRRQLWRRGTHRNAYHLGFLASCPHDLPISLPARADYADHAPALAALAQAGNALAAALERLLDSPGQGFLATAEEALQHPLDKETTALLLEVIGQYFAVGCRGEERRADLAGAEAAAEEALRSPREELAALIAAVPALEREIRAMLVLAHTSESFVTPILARTTASGTLLRRKLEPVFVPLLAHIAVLRAPALPQAARRC